MKVFDISRRAARSLTNAKTRTVLTSLAIAVGAFTITVSLAAGQGAREYADNLINSNVNPQALFIYADEAIVSGQTSRAPIQEYDTDTGSIQGASYKLLTQADIDKIAARDDIESVVPIYSLTVEYVTFEGSNTKYVADVGTYDSSIISGVAEGALPPQNTDIADDEVVVPESYVETLIEKKIIKSAGDLIGKKIVMTASQATVTPSSQEIEAAFASGGEAAVQLLLKPATKQFTFKVVAISEQSAEALTSSTSIQIAPSAARSIAEFTTKGTDNYQKYFAATAVVKANADPTKVKEKLKDAGYYSQTAKDLQSVVFTVVNTLQGIVLGFGIIALIASVFGIINTQYISVLERTREIGLMKALGMRGSAVSRLFQFEAAWIGFLGGIIGAAVAIGAGLALNPWITSTLGLSEGTNLLIFQPIPIAVMIIALIIIAMLAGWFPARKAAKLDPIAALRTE